MSARPHKGRGAVSRRPGRFVTRPVEFNEEEAALRNAAMPETVLKAMSAGKIISHNASPDVPFDRSINPYQGCEHGCIYCYARPSHSYLDLSPGLDFETRIFYKPNAASRLLQEWEKPGYECKPITIGANTDPYQPAEKSTRITRQLLELFDKHHHPVNLITKGALITRDVDLLAGMASRGLCSVAISLPTMDVALKRIMEPRVPSAESRLKAIETLSSHGVPTSVLMAPLIPAINDNEIEQVLEAVAQAGAANAHYIFLRLPHEVKGLFVEWLETHFPDRASHVMSLVKQASSGRDYDNRFGVRQTGRGAYADMLGKRFRAACRRHRLAGDRYQLRLDSSGFQRPGQQQLGLDL
ncbi:MAG: PA0069 family radical SAM protein [Gammaproteobacteria bacterium]|jgi:DNA repair photolyase|nr:PA0069 family radical SAM protein [Gammaproteobacteria bacterium]MDH3806968.1 PA0069 family radical SAM protein [Gammaproteobacteria bacterium]